MLSSRKLCRFAGPKLQSYLAVLGLEDRTAPATLVWTGDADGNWATNIGGNTNWLNVSTNTDNVLPANGDDLLFPAAAGNHVNANGDAQGLFRFFGDVNGDRHVDIADFGLFATSYGLHTGQTGFLAAFDFNGDGVIDIADFGQFAIRMFTVLP